MAELDVRWREDDGMMRMANEFYNRIGGAHSMNS
jgi:hypothetical protein